MINLGSAYGAIEISTDKAQQNVQSLAQTMRNVGQTMTTTLSLPILGVMGAGLKAAAGFEQSMNQIQVVGGVAGDAMASLNAKALQLGAETSFSAGEAAQGMLELAKAGLDADEVMASIAGTLDLAAAGNLGVGQAAEITANAMNAFSLPAEDATRVANLLAAAANSSSVEVTDMAQAFQMSASVFGANKVPIDQLATAIAILGNNGLKGSDAGTSMKTMLMRLTAPTKEAAGEMQALGLQVYEADGSMRSFQDILGDLGTVTANLTDEQRNMALTTIFGADAIRAANILIKEGAGEFDTMMGSVNQAGAATEVANARMKGLAGAIQYIQGTIESLMIGAFQPFLQGLGDMIRGVADAMAAFGNLPQPVINAVLAFLAVLGVAGPIIFALGQIGVVMGALLSPIGLVTLGLAGLAAAFAGDLGGIRTVTGNLANYVTMVLDAGAASAETQEALGLLPAPLQRIVAPIGQVIDGFHNYYLSVQDAGFGSIEAQESISLFPAVLQPIMGVMDQTIGAFQNLFAVVADAGPLSIEASEALGLFPAALQPIVGWSLAAWGGLQNFIAVVRDAGLTSIEAREALGLLPVGLQEMVGGLMNAWAIIGPIFDNLRARVVEAVAVMLQGFAGLGPQLSALGGAFAQLWAAVAPILTQLGALIAGTLGVVAVLAINYLAAAFTALPATVGTVIETLAGVISGIATVVSSMVAGVTALMQGDFAGAWTAAQGVVSGAMSALMAIVGGFVSSVGISWAALRSTIVGTLETLGFTELAAQIDGIAAKVETGWLQIKDSVTVAVANFSWADFVTALSDWSGYITALDWGSYIATALDWASYIGQLTWSNVFVPALDWAAYVTPIAWDTLVTALSDWGAYIAALDWTTIITTAIDWATWVPALAWNTFVTLLDWATIIAAFAWTDYISQIDWSTSVSALSWADFVTALSDWSGYIASIDWGGYITALADWSAFIGAFAWESFVSKLEWPLIAQFNWSEWVAKLEWPVISWPGFSTFVKALVWPMILWPGFGSFVKMLAWPSISWPGWKSFIPGFSWPTIPEFPGWDWLWGNSGGGSGEPKAKSDERSALDWLGGLVDVPAGRAAMVPAASAGSATGGGTVVNLSIEVGAISNGVDMEELAWRVEQRLKRALSGR